MLILLPLLLQVVNVSLKWSAATGDSLCHRVPSTVQSSVGVELSHIYNKRLRMAIETVDVLLFKSVIAHVQQDQRDVTVLIP